MPNAASVSPEASVPLARVMLKAGVESPYVRVTSLALTVTARVVMVWARAALVLPLKVGVPVEVPLYSAVIECDPAASAGEHVAVFPDRAVVQIVAAPSRKVTEPTLLGLVEPVTVAVNVRALP